MSSYVMACSAPNSTLAIFAGTDYCPTSSRIIEPYFSPAKATYYIDCKTGQASMTAIIFKGREQKTKIRAVCAYL